MASNYEDVLGQLRAAGLLVDALDVGRMRRCKVEGEREKRGWYCLHELRLDSGEDVLVGSFGVWRGNENNAQKVELRKTALSREQAASLRARLQEDRRRAELLRKAEAERAAERARKAWQQCTEQGDSDYLKRKGVAAHGVRFSPQGAMVIPLLDTGGRIHGLQIIRGKQAQAGGRKLEKEYWPQGIITKGHFHLMGMVNRLVLVGEGYATAASLHEATGLPVAAAFDAGNIPHVVAALRKRYKLARILVCADDDDTQKCRACKARVWPSDGDTCPSCGEKHQAANAGISAASLASIAVGGAWMAPTWADPEARKQGWLQHGRKLNDFNDLHLAEGLHVVRAQVEARLSALGWRATDAAPPQPSKGAGEADAPEELAPLKPIDTLDELLERFALVYGQGGMVFDHQEHALVGLKDMSDACLTSELHKAWREHPEKAIVRVSEVGFDPAGTDKAVRCNLWSGWPTRPRAGSCDYLLELLRHMCAGDSRPEELYDWVICWLAYPIQHPGAKMKTTLVIHGPQGTGKNMFFEAIMEIYGRYGRVIDQSAIEDKFNDWASRKLFLIADEVVARSDLYHVKNKLKAFITGEWIRINPKNMAAYDERNHVNMVFLSNEAMPVVLEDDDRRHAVIWTPEKLTPEFYGHVLKEIADGGVEALHHHLLHLNLDTFGPGTLPPMTDAKRELIGLSQDSPSQFMRAFEGGDIEGFPARDSPKLLSPMLSTDLFALYGAWCARVGLRALNQPRFANALMRKHRATTVRKRYATEVGSKGPAAITFLPGGHECGPGRNESDWLGERLDLFRRALKDFRGAA
ncbi:DUF5906 domain-containing protein [Pseudacidovorax sp. NFM-22]|uniref:DUF5906 domain-containing protein n=1 Tax=Pseudacidovorax sp. NFM-22 TaxID=2744469 RepID=UPI001F1712BD|nr:DUF5906 domain-containing protein [Pseudacidovorax sp. NFM-22]